MSPLLLPLEAPPGTSRSVACRPRSMSYFQRQAQQWVQQELEHWQAGNLTLESGGGRTSYGPAREHTDLSATLKVHDPRFFTDLVLGGNVAVGAAYIRGEWDSDDLVSLVRMICRQAQLTQRTAWLGEWFTRPLRRWMHWWHRNTRAGSRRNIQQHYDLGNDFYKLFLDESWMYSCGIFEHPEAALYDASIAKLDRICRKLQLSPRDHVLEIGTGWGGFALYAAQNYGCRITTTTISDQQYDLARERIAQAGLQDRVTLLKTDYRDLHGEYDKLVSIEMFEAVGYRYFDTFFAQCQRLLRPEGSLLLQTITYADKDYAAYLRDVDFIQQFIFPGGCLPSVTELCASVTRASNLRMVHLEDIGPHYAETLRHWRERFLNNLDQVRDLGYSEHFLRMWDYYFAYCEGAFRERQCGDIQIVLHKPLCRTEVPLGQLTSG